MSPYSIKISARYAGEHGYEFSSRVLSFPDKISALEAWAKIRKMSGREFTAEFCRGAKVLESVTLF